LQDGGGSQCGGGAKSSRVLHGLIYVHAVHLLRILDGVLASHCKGVARKCEPVKWIVEFGDMQELEAIHVETGLPGLIAPAKRPIEQRL
jgi:hypothetical protein